MIFCNFKDKSVKPAEATNWIIFWIEVLEKDNTISIIWILTLIKDLPIAVAIKKVLKSIKRCPQVRPAKSKRGFGNDAKRRTIKNEFFWT